MKTKITRKAIRERYPKIICVGYALLQHLLTFENPKYYTCGYEGWHSDVYELENFPGTVIVTGSQPFGNIKPSYNMAYGYDRKAAEVLHSTTNYEKQKKAIDTLIMCFVMEAGAGDKR